MLTLRQRAKMGETENSVQRAVIDALRLKGYTVLECSVRVRKCAFCGKYPSTGKAGYGMDSGIPDTLVWVNGAWRGLEIKGPLTPLNPRQKELLAEGKIVVARSIEDALEAVSGWERSEQ